jgi:hypothetical protein
MRVALFALLVFALAPSYDRSDWGHWRDFDGDCLSTRQEVLLSDGRDVEVEGCRVVSGTWVDLYTAEIVTDPSVLDIDHVVPLRHAFEAGGWAWSGERKRAFANDERYLVATHRTQNRTKGSKGPEEWMPPREDAKCWYLELWLKAKEEYELQLSLAEARWIFVDSGCGL